jgi:hypothetical protein
MDADYKRAAMHAAANMANWYAMLGCKIGEIDCRRHPMTGAPCVSIQVAPPKSAEFIHFDFNINAFAGD